MNRPLLEVRDLTVEFRQRRTTVRAVDGVSFDIGEGEVLGLVGESGSGKSTIGRAILGLTDATAGTIVFDGNEITTLRGRDRRALATDIQVVFQDPLSSLDPRWTMERSLSEPLRTHRQLTDSELQQEVVRLLGLVGLPPEMRIDCRVSCPEVNDNGLRSPAPSRSRPGSSCATNRPAPSTSPRSRRR